MLEVNQDKGGNGNPWLPQGAILYVALWEQFNHILTTI